MSARLFVAGLDGLLEVLQGGVQLRDGRLNENDPET